MNTFNKIGMVAIVVSFLLFLSAYYYHQQSGVHDLRYSKIVATVTSQLSNDPPISNPQFSSSGYVFTEERGILVAMIASVLLCIIAVVLNIIGHWRFGNNQSFLPLNFSALIIAVWVSFTIFQLGLHTYA